MHYVLNIFTKQQIHQFYFIIQIEAYETLVLVILKVEHLDSNWDIMSLLQQKIFNIYFYCRNMIDIDLFRSCIGDWRFRRKICGRQFCMKVAIGGIINIMVRKILIYLQIFKN